MYLEFLGLEGLKFYAVKEYLKSEHGNPFYTPRESTGAPPTMPPGCPKPRARAMSRSRPRTPALTYTDVTRTMNARMLYVPLSRHSSCLDEKVFGISQD